MRKYLQIQKEYDLCTYYKNSPRAIILDINNLSNCKSLKEELYDNLNIKVKEILKKYNYNYIEDKSKILTNNPLSSCPIVQELKKQKLNSTNYFNK